MDNLYTSPLLFSELHRLGFEACGTLRVNRRGVPPEAKSPLPKGERRVIQLEGMNIVQWHDKRTVSLLSTIHSDRPVQVQRRSCRAPGGCETVEKPEAITEYNKYMGGVDKGDQLLSYYGFPHRTVKWWKRAFFFLFDAAIVNSYIMYSQQANGQKLSHELFRIKLAKELLQLASELSSSSDSSDSSHGPSHHPQQPPAHLTERHFLGQFEKSQGGRQIQRCCVVCSNKKGRGKKQQHFTANNATLLCV